MCGNRGRMWDDRKGRSGRMWMATGGERRNSGHRVMSSKPIANMIIIYPHTEDIHDQG